MNVTNDKKPEWVVALKTWRERNGLTQLEAARKLGVEHGTLRHWERGRKPGASMLALVMGRIKGTKKDIDSRKHKMHSACI